MSADARRRAGPQVTSPAERRSGSSGTGTRILVVDNYDSFVFNLVQYLGQLDVECVVRRNDELTVEQAIDMDTDGILLSPGPSTPERAGICVPLVAALVSRDAGSRPGAAGDPAPRRVPVLGVCLGHQAIGVACGATVTRAPELLHGKTSEVRHAGVGVLAGLPDPFTATRYHSLTVAEETLPAELEVTGRTSSGVVMAMRHRSLPVEGVQFHPESVLTQGGHRMLANWLAVCGHPAALSRAPELVAQVERRRLAATA